MTVSPAEVRAELARRARRELDRRAARTDFHAAVRFTGESLHRWQQVAAHTLQEVSESTARGESVNVLFQVHPRIGKTRLLGERWVPWHISAHPGHRAIIASATHTLARRTSLRARHFAEDLRPVFPEVEQGQPWADAEWHLSAPGSGDGYCIAAGVGGNIMGSGFHIGLVDDPIKSIAQAESPTQRNHAWEWFNGTFGSRKQRGGSIVLMHQRWHEDDVAGRWIRWCEDRGIPLRIVKFDPVATRDEIDPLGDVWRRAGEVVCPEEMPMRDLMERKAGMSARMWAAMFEQSPQPAEGGMFKAAWWFTPDGAEANRYQGDPFLWAREADEVMVTVDSSAKGNDDSDFNALQCLGRKGVMVALLDRVKRRMEYPEFERTLDAMHDRWAAHRTVTRIEEAGHGNVYLQRRRGKIPGLVGFQPNRDTPGKGKSKEDRARYVTGPAEAGQFLLPHARHAPWVDDYLDTLCAFPYGKNDDEVDATSMAFVVWRQHHSGRALGGSVPGGVYFD